MSLPQTIILCISFSVLFMAGAPLVTRLVHLLVGL